MIVSFHIFAVIDALSAWLSVVVVVGNMTLSTIGYLAIVGRAHHDPKSYINYKKH